MHTVPSSVQRTELQLHLLLNFMYHFHAYRAISIMREARAKLRLIKPEDMDMEEYMVPFTGLYVINLQI